ncbi:MAG: hypothetical protein ACI92G_003546 [Candidatus Pelagisphaera sp.]|jgi:hypothetical protein
MFNSNHSRRGILFAAGPPFRKGVSLFPPNWVPGTDGNGEETATILDVFPTVLAAMKLPVPVEAEGRVLTEILKPGWLDGDGPTTFEGELSNQSMSNLDIEEPAEDPALEALQDLGYVE